MFLTKKCCFDGVLNTVDSPHPPNKPFPMKFQYMITSHIMYCLYHIRSYRVYHYTVNNCDVLYMHKIFYWGHIVVCANRESESLVEVR